jgi:hypothetical protein
LTSVRGVSALTHLTSNYFFISKKEKDEVLKKVKFSYYFVLLLVLILILASLPFDLYGLYDHIPGLILYLFAFWLLIEIKSLLDARDVIFKLKVREELETGSLSRYPLSSTSRRGLEEPIGFQGLASFLEGSSRATLSMLLPRKVRR